MTGDPYSKKVHVKGKPRRDAAGPEPVPGAASEEEEHVLETEAPIQEDVASLKAKAEEYLELARRVQADFENYKKRMVREQSHAIERAGERVVRELLPVIDDLDRTIDAS